MTIPLRATLLPLAIALLAIQPSGAAGQAPATPDKAAAEAAAPGSQVLARVNGEEVMAEDVAARLATRHQGAGDSAQGAVDLDRLIDNVVNDVLLGQEARTMGLDQDPGVRSEVLEFENELVYQMLQRAEVEDKAQPSDEEVRRVFEEQYHRVDLRTVTALDQATAEAMMARLRDGADMAEMARTESADPYAMRGGLAADMVRYDMKQELAEVAFALEPGRIGGPVRTDLGWTVLRPEAFRPADPARFQELEPLCRRMARYFKAQALEQALAARVRQEIPVTLDQEVIDSVQPEILPDGRFMPKVPDKEAILGRIGSEVVITAGEYARSLVDRWKGVRNLEAAEASSPIILGILVEQKLLLAEGYRRGYRERPQIKNRVRAFETQSLIPLYFQEVLASRIEVDETKMKAYYEANKQRFHRPPRLRLGQITVATLDEAADIIRQLRQGTDLAWLAREKSIDGYKSTGGDRGWFVPSPGVDELNDRLMEAEAGTVLNPYGTPGNVVVVKILAREEQGIYEYAEMSGNLREMVFEDELQREMAAFMKKLRSRAEIVIDREAVARLAITAAPESPSGEAEHGGNSHGS